MLIFTSTARAFPLEVYYLSPLVLSLALLFLYQFAERRPRFKAILIKAGGWSPVLMPNLLALNTFLAGVILLVSGSSPAVATRLHWLKDFLPLPVLEVSHFLASVAGVALLFLSYGLHRRLDAAYPLTVILLATGILVSLLKGFNYEEAIILAVMLTLFIPSRRFFHRRSSLLEEPFTRGWILSVTVAIIASVCLGFFIYKHVDYSDELWWRFSFDADAPRFLRALVGISVVALFFSLSHLMKVAKGKTSRSVVDMGKVCEIVCHSRAIKANLALLDDKFFLWSDSQKAFIMYGVKGKSFVAVGDPVGSEEEWPELIWKFRSFVDTRGGWTVFSEIGREHLHLYLDIGLSLVKLGEEARVSLADFSLDGSERRELRQDYHRGEKEGFSFAVIPREQVSGYLGEFKIISDSWLAERNTKEKGFSMGRFDETYLRFFPAAVIRHKEKIVAFANIWTSLTKEEFSIDLMRSLSGEAPQGVMDFLFVHLLLWGKEQGYRWFNLGMVPLAGLKNRSFAPIWNRIGSMIFRHGEYFYNFQGLRYYKDKFNPVWSPSYLASPGGLALPRVLADIAALGSGGYKGIFAK